MKSISILLLLLSTFVLSSTAQVMKGSWLVGGSLTGSHEKQNGTYGDKQRTTSVTLMPRAGYFLADRFCVGLSLTMAGNRQKDDILTSTGTGNYIVVGTDHFRSRQFGIGPFARYYQPISKFFLVGEVTYQASWIRTKGSQFDPSTGNVVNDIISQYDQRFFTVGAGPAFFLTPAVSLEALLQYKHTGHPVNSDFVDNVSEFYISVGFQIYLGSKGE